MLIFAPSQTISNPRQDSFVIAIYSDNSGTCTISSDKAGLKFDTSVSITANTPYALNVDILNRSQTYTLTATLGAEQATATIDIASNCAVLSLSDVRDDIKNCILGIEASTNERLKFRYYDVQREDKLPRGLDRFFYVGINSVTDSPIFQARLE